MFSKAIVRPPASSFAAGLTTSSLGPPDYKLALKQHAAYCEALKRCGLALTILDCDERYPDATFVEDTAVIVGAPQQKPARQQGLAGSGNSNPALPDGRASAWNSGGRTTAWNSDGRASRVVLTRPGAPSRRAEVESVEKALSALFDELHSIEEPGTLDGGDVCEAGDHFFIGVSERTNEAGARQLAKLVASVGYTATVIDTRGMKSLLHLKSGLTYLGDKRLVVTEELADEEALRDFELIKVGPSESYAANCVRVNDHVLIAAGYPNFERTLRDLGYETLPLEMSEFQKMDGGLSCLSLRF